MKVQAIEAFARAQSISILIGLVIELNQNIDKDRQQKLDRNLIKLG